MWDDKPRWVGNSGRRGVSEDFHKGCLRFEHKLTAYVEEKLNIELAIMSLKAFNKSVL